MGRRSDAVEEMMRYCDRRFVMSFAELCRTAMESDQEWFECLCKPGVATVMAEYIRDCAPEYKRKKSAMFSDAIAREIEKAFAPSEDGIASEAR